MMLPSLTLHQSRMPRAENANRFGTRLRSGISLLRRKEKSEIFHDDDISFLCVLQNLQNVQNHT